MMQTHDVRPDHADDYERAHRTLAQFLAEDTTLTGRPVGHFEVILGQDDQFIHVWKYEGGNADMDKDLGSLRTSAEYKRLHKEVSKHVVSRSNQVRKLFQSAFIVRLIHSNPMRVNTSLVTLNNSFLKNRFEP